MAVDVAAVERTYRDLLDLLLPGWADDSHTAGTPKRVARWWAEFLDHDPGTYDTVFPLAHTDQMVVVSGIDTWSLCAHHLLPFSTSITVGYLARGKVLGLSKFARIARMCSHRATTQEALVEGIANLISEVADTPDVAVVGSGLHLCMAMRGVRIPATMTTSVARGAFRDDDSCRAEWLSLVR